MNVFEHLLCDRFAFGFEVGDLAADHAIYGACGSGNFRQHGYAALGVDGSRGDDFESEGEQGIAGENGGGFAEFLVARRLAAAQIVVVEGRQIVVNQRVGVDEFDGACRDAMRE